MILLDEPPCAGSRFISRHQAITPAPLLKQPDEAAVDRLPRLRIYGEYLIEQRVTHAAGVKAEVVTQSVNVASDVLRTGQLVFTPVLIARHARVPPA
jgi:hypothetical protein